MKPTLNLLPPAKKPYAARKSPFIAFAVPALYIAAILTMWLLNSYEIKKMDSTIDELSAYRAKLKEHLAAAPRPAPPSEALSEAAVLGNMRETPPWDTILAELSVIVPRTIWLDLIESSDSRHMRFKGFSVNQSEIAKFIAKLERSPYFNNVEIVYSQKGKNGTAFELRARMKWT